MTIAYFTLISVRGQGKSLQKAEVRQANSNNLLNSTYERR